MEDGRWYLEDVEILQFWDFQDNVCVPFSLIKTNDVYLFEKILVSNSDLIKKFNFIFLY